MSTESTIVVPLDLHTADERTLAALTNHQNAMLAERLPNDPPVPLDVRQRGWLHIDPTIDLGCWIVWSADQRAIIANVWAEAQHTGDRRDVVNFNIMVLPAYRQHGLGRRLLAAVAAYAHQTARHVLITQTSGDRTPGVRFMEQIGATPTSGAWSNQLAIADLDLSLIRQWIAQGEQAQGFELGWWEDAYPAADLAAIAQLHEVMNDAPRITDALADAHFTPEQLRASEQAMHERGEVRWSAFVRERATGILAGFTEVLWNAERPTLLEQGSTGVVPTYRNHGLGRWLKAAMLDKIVRERPSVQFVRTGTALTNTPMLNINTALGFKPFSVDTWWEMSIAQVQAYLGER